MAMRRPKAMRRPMAMRRRPAIVVSLAVGVVAVVVAGLVTAPIGPTTAGIQPSGGSSTIIHGDLPPPPPGHEVYGFVPYWEMDAGIGRASCRERV